MMELTKFHLTSRGFTLIELIIVVAIIGIVVAAISFRMSSNIPAMRIDAATSQIRDHIRLAQEYAKLTQDKYYVTFDTSNNTYGVYKSSDDSVITEPTSGNNISYDLDTDEQLKGGSIDSVDFGGSSTVEFDARGQPYGGKGGSLLSSAGTVSISYDSESATIKVEPVTGAVSIQ